jgi:hypothetical protein
MGRNESSYAWWSVGFAFAVAGCSSSSSAGSGTPLPQDAGPAGEASSSGAPEPEGGGATTPADGGGGCAPATGGATATMLYEPQDQVIEMQAANGLLYFADPTGVYSLPPSGGTANLIAAPPSMDGFTGSMVAFTVTATDVVWGDHRARSSRGCT